MAAARGVSTFSDEDVRACRAAFPEDRAGRYDMVLADPPWRYERGNNIDVPYPTMSAEELKALPVGRVAAPNSVCCMWTTSPKMPEAIDIMRAWGFEYKTVLFTWLKTNQSMEPAYVPGFYTMSCTEHVLIGVRGSMQAAKRVFNCKQLVTAARTAHSEKPPCVRDRVAALFDCRHRLELFSRHIVSGWSSWGLDVPGWFYDADDVAPLVRGWVFRAFLSVDEGAERPVRLLARGAAATTRGAGTDSYTARCPVVAVKARPRAPREQALQPPGEPPEQRPCRASGAPAQGAPEERVPVSRGDVVVRGPAKPSLANFATWWRTVNRATGKANSEVYHVHPEYLAARPDVRAIVEAAR